MGDLLVVLAGLIGFVVLVFAAAMVVALWLGKPPRQRSRRPRRPGRD